MNNISDVLFEILEWQNFLKRYGYKLKREFSANEIKIEMEKQNINSELENISESLKNELEKKKNFFNERRNKAELIQYNAAISILYTIKINILSDFIKSKTNKQLNYYMEEEQLKNCFHNEILNWEYLINTVIKLAKIKENFNFEDDEIKYKLSELKKYGETIDYDTFVESIIEKKEILIEVNEATTKDKIIAEISEFEVLKKNVTRIKVKKIIDNFLDITEILENIVEDYFKIIKNNYDDDTLENLSEIILPLEYPYDYTNSKNSIKYFLKKTDMTKQGFEKGINKKIVKESKEIEDFKKIKNKKLVILAIIIVVLGSMMSYFFSNKKTSEKIMGKEVLSNNGHSYEKIKKQKEVIIQKELEENKNIENEEKLLKQKEIERQKETLREKERIRQEELIKQKEVELKQKEIELKNKENESKQKEKEAKNKEKIKEMREFRSSEILKSIYSKEIMSIDKINLKDVDINYADKQGMTFLIVAIQNKNEKLVMELLNKGADINKADSYRTTPLMYASRTGNLSLIEFLLKKGALIGARDEFGETCYDSAMGNKDVIRLLNKY